jgi:hypothetical protein
VGGIRFGPAIPLREHAVGSEPYARLVEIFGKYGVTWHGLVRLGWPIDPLLHRD